MRVLRRIESRLERAICWLETDTGLFLAMMAVLGIAFIGLGVGYHAWSW